MANLWRSTSLRWSILLTLILWFLTMTVAIGVAERTEQVLIEGPSEAADDLEERFLETYDAERFNHPSLWAEDFAGVIERLPPRTDESFLGALKRYQSLLEVRLQRSSGRELDELQARRWLLGEAVPLTVGDEPVDLYIELIEAEFPEALHDPLLASLEQRREAWPAQEAWLALPAPERVRLVLERFLDEAEDGDEPWCLALAQPVGELVLQNIELEEELASEAPRYRVFRVAELDRVRKEAAYCWARVFSLGDHSEVLLGVDATEAFGALLQIRDELGGGFVFTFLLSVLVGSFLGYRIHRRLRVLNAAVVDVGAGALDARVPGRPDGDDFDRLGSSINDMLDRLQSLVAGVRAVSDNIAHDLKTPLTRLRHQIEFLAQQETPSSDGVAQVAEEADRLLETLTALLRIAQLEQGSFRQASVRFDLGRLVEDTVELYEPVFGEVGQTLGAMLPGEPVWVTGDRQLWNQALSNLLENALTHAASGSGVSVNLVASEQGAVLEVCDTGPGLPEHEFERVFERFYRADRARSRPGTGLGLSLVKAIADAHGVELELENREGLVVRFCWPTAASGP